MKLSVKDDIDFQSSHSEINKNKIVINNDVLSNKKFQIVNEDATDQEKNRKQVKNKISAKHFIRLGLEKIGFYLRSNHIILSKRNKLVKFVNSIQDELPFIKHRPISKSKHVMFIDQLGSTWSLELIHTIQVNNRHSTSDDPREKIVTSQSIINYKQSTNNDRISKIVPKFKLKLSSNEVNLIKNGICLNSVEIYNHYSIRGTILTLNQATEPIDYSKKSPKQNDTPSLNYFLTQLKKNIFMENKKTQGSNTKLDLVYIIWSIDEWETWKSQVAIQKACKAGSSEDNVIKTHEFFLQNVDKLLKNSGKLLQIVICHQVNDTIFYDTNNEKCYCFEFVSSI